MNTTRGGEDESHQGVAPKESPDTMTCIWEGEPRADEMELCSGVLSDRGCAACFRSLEQGMGNLQTPLMRETPQMVSAPDPILFIIPWLPDDLSDAGARRCPTIRFDWCGAVGGAAASVVQQ